MYATRALLLFVEVNQIHKSTMDRYIVGSEIFLYSSQIFEAYLTERPAASEPAVHLRMS